MFSLSAAAHASRPAAAEPEPPELQKAKSILKDTALPVKPADKPPETKSSEKMAVALYGGKSPEGADLAAAAGMDIDDQNRHLDMEGGPQEVQVRAALLHFSCIDVPNQSFRVKMRVQCRWRCPVADLEAAQARRDMFDATWEPHWTPVITCLGTMSVQSLTRLFVVEEEEEEEEGTPTATSAIAPADAAEAGKRTSALSSLFGGGGDQPSKRRVLYIRAFYVRQVEIVDVMNLRVFPFDLQDFAVTLIGENVRVLTPLPDGDRPVASIDPTAMSILPSFSLYRPLPAVYRMRSGASLESQDEQPLFGSALQLASTIIRLRNQHKRGTSRRSCSRGLVSRSGADGSGAAPPERNLPVRPGGGSSRSELCIVVFFNREWLAYLWDSYFLLFIIGAAAIANWAVHWREVGTRLSLDVTLLLVAVAFKQVNAGERPPVAYLTLQDLYTILIICFLFGCLVLHGILGHMIADCDTISGECTFRVDGWEMEDMGRFDRATLYIYIGVFILAHIGYILFANFKFRLVRRHITLTAIAPLGFRTAGFVRRRSAWYEQDPQLGPHDRESKEVHTAPRGAHAALPHEPSPSTAMEA